MNPNENLNRIIDNINKLPELFHVAIRVARMLDNIDVNIREISEVINIDPSLTTQVLKLANSAYYGFSREITSIQDAITKLGFKTIKSLVFVAISHGILNHKIDGYSLEKGELWKNAVTCAVYARALAIKTKYRDPELAFTAGLLRDIGKLIIHEYVGEKYEQIVQAVNSQGVTFLQAESRILGFSHSETGALLAQKWNFPHPLVESIKYHHSFEEAKKAECQDLKLLSVIHIADSVTNILGAGIGSDGLMYGFESSAVENIGLFSYYENIEDLLSQIADLSDEISAMVNLVSERR